MSEFGELLRKYRQSCKYPLTNKQLSQERLGELLGNELGLFGGYTGAAVSDWERGESKIHADDRLLLVGLIKVLYECGGLKSVLEANVLLDAGNYRSLSLNEKTRIFSNNLAEKLKESTPSEKRLWFISFLQEHVFYGINAAELRNRLAEADDGPPPTWPRRVVAVTNVIMSRWSALQTLWILGWIWVIVLGAWLMIPSLDWPFTSQEQAAFAMAKYAGGILAIPLLIGLLANTSNNLFWREHKQARELMVRLYTYQGAGIGFFLGYSSIFTFQLVLYHVAYFLNGTSRLSSATFLEILEMTILLVISYGCARLVPHNLWKAYQRLEFSDGSIFYVVWGVGIFWGLLFYIFHPVFLNHVSGPIIILLAFTLASFAEVLRYKQTGSTIIPAYWWLIFYGSILIIYLISAHADFFGIFLLAGLILSFSILLAIGHIYVTLRGLVSFVLFLFLLIFVFQWNLWIGRISLGIALVAWWKWGKKYLSLPPSFWGITLTLAVTAWATQQGWLSKLEACIAFGTVTLLVMLWEIRSARKLSMVI
jgi:hypothetical protein